MNTHTIVAAALTAASFPAFAQPGMTPSGFVAATSRDTAAPPILGAPPALRATDFVLAKIDQNNTPPDRGGDPSGRTHDGTRP
ncbi:hypothetical protein [Burkholderia dolosa]|jgi:hypothetical protein|uniref:hypothetical protein n=1 Tax=Burkholderia dolosa TaxID=152500 RepID=UPI001B9202A5|nr:hypothetical protein [Burkholderia dolosa]MBR8058081.1 hypothetical protein [Burkholderia dolosa]MBR8311992.1 hypothetical protein [Burkholderia dolosa]